MKMIRIWLIIALVIAIFGLATSPSHAGSFFDNFDDGDADGWWLGYCLSQPSIFGNWRVEDGVFVQNCGCDGALTLLEDFQISDQIVETELKLKGPSGYGGITIWFQNNSNGVFVGLSNGAIGVSEVVDNVWYGVQQTYPYNINDDRWATLKVEINSASGDLEVFADGDYVLTYHSMISHRVGQTGLYSGNAGGYFDNFSITSDSIVDSFTDKSQCKNDGWKVFTNPTFKNQGGCVSYLESNGSAGKRD